MLCVERETGLEPATFCLEGRRSAKLSYSRLLFKYTYWRDPLQSPRSAILRTSQNAAMHIS